MRSSIAVCSLLVCALVSAVSGQELTVTATAANTVSSKTSIDLPGLTGNPLAIIVATPLGDTKLLNPHPLGAWYYSGKWNLFNSNQSVMPLGAKYKVRFFLRPGPGQFLHLVTKENTGAEGTYIDNPLLNGNPTAQVQILQNHAPEARTPYNPNPNEAKAEYSTAAGRWYIANINGQPIGRGAAYNVVVDTPAAGPVVAPAQPSGPPAIVPPAGGVIAGNVPPYTPRLEPTPSPSPSPAPVLTPITVPSPPARTPVATPTPSPPGPPRLNGWVDMHTHPMSHLGFGKKLLHGVPDPGSLIPAGTRFCNPQDTRATNIHDALGNCSSTHGGWGLGVNECGDSVRSTVISELFDSEFTGKLKNDLLNGGNLIGDHHHEGVDSTPQQFLYWPHQSSKVHQQMWWEWIKRAKEEGNLRVMVALAVNSELLAEILNGNQPRDDRNAADQQIDEITLFVGRHSDFMEIARSSADVRRIVGAGKLAVILGVEVDNIGNFNKSTTPPYGYAASLPTEAVVKAEIQRLYAKGVRYAFPIHLLDNKFGGTAVYEDLFNFANKYSTGNFFGVRHSGEVGFALGEASDAGVYLSSNKDIGLILDGLALVPYKPAFNANPLDSRFCVNALPFHGSIGCWSTFKTIRGLLTPPGEWQNYKTIPAGHMNNKGLTSAGKVAIKEMMKLGMMIDIDHMSDLSQDDTLTIAEQYQYPVNIGHNGLRHPGSVERHASSSSTRRVAALGGLFGIGTADSDKHKSDAVSFIASFNEVWALMAQNGNSPRLAIGTDVNGMERLPRASAGLNTATFYTSVCQPNIPATLGDFPMSNTGSRCWDYTKEGVSQYGMMADFIRDIRNRDLSVQQRLMDSAEYFALMWEKVERQRSLVQ
ncbi:MAG: membrane dipeptidase [Pyrinomonadaceae bacterium]